MASLEEIEKRDGPMIHYIDNENAPDSASLINPDDGRFLNGVKEILVPIDLTTEGRKAITYAVALAP